MTKNIILAGVGGQGILTIAAIIDMAALQLNMHIKQAEVHGMSQRGGAVQSHLRISDDEIYSDLIQKGHADLILSAEPMESLRYLPFLSKTGHLITSIVPFVNIPNYPDIEDIFAKIKETTPNHTLLNAEKLAKEAGNIRSANVVMVGAATKVLEIDPSVFEECITNMFAAKGEKVVNANLKAFRLGLETSK